MGNPDPSDTRAETRSRFPWRLVFRLFFFGSVIAIIVGSLIPSSDMPDTSIDDKVIHFCAYLIAGVLAIQGFPKKRMRFVCLAALLVIGCGIEFAQQHVPGRSFDLIDMLANTIGATVSIFASRVFSA